MLKFLSMFRDSCNKHSLTIYYVPRRKMQVVFLSLMFNEISEGISSIYIGKQLIIYVIKLSVGSQFAEIF